MKIRRIFNNIGIKVLCLLLAIVMWLYANKAKGPETLDRFVTAIRQGREGKVTFLDISAKPTGLQKEWIANPPRISLEAKCLVAEIRMGDLQVIVKLTREDEESSRVTLTEENVVLPEGLVFVKAEPKELQITAAP